MFDLNALSEFSRAHCISICAFLVPANLLATLQTLIFVGVERPAYQVRFITGFANLYATLMLLHVTIWLVIGVVMVPTFVLLALGTVCLGVNFWAIAHPTSLAHLLQLLLSWLQRKVEPLLASFQGSQPTPQPESSMR